MLDMFQKEVHFSHQDFTFSQKTFLVLEIPQHGSLPCI